MTDESTTSASSERPTLEELARLTGGRVEGDGRLAVSGVSPLERAGPDELGYLASARYARDAGRSRAGAFLVAASVSETAPTGRPRVVVDDGPEALRRVLLRLHPEAARAGGVHPTAVLGRGVGLGEGVDVGAYAVLEDGVSVGGGTWIGPHVVLGRGARVGRACALHPHVVLYAGTVVGDRVTLHAGARLGVDGFGWSTAGGVPTRIPHVGRCVVGDDVEIGANATVDRGCLGDTVVEEHAKLDNLVHLGHNVRLGARSLLAGLVGIAGSSRVGRDVRVAGQAGISDHREVGDGARIAAAAKVLRDVRAGEVVSGCPARPHRETLRRQAEVRRLPRLLARVRALEAAVRALGEGRDA